MVNDWLRYSLNNYKVITIMYIKGLEITQRKIQVLKMDDEHIKALDIDKWKFRTFKIDNILSAMDAKLIDGSITMKEKCDVNLYRKRDLESYISVCRG